MLRIAPSILAADFARLEEQVRTVEAAGADLIHVDVMDGHFVPNLSLGPAVVEALRRITRLPLDVHLMVRHPERFLEPFSLAGANHISFHIEAEGNPWDMLAWLKERGIGRGVAANPETPVERVLEWLPHVDMVLVMTVHPGFSGQAFLPECLEKVRRLRREESRRRDSGALAGLDIVVDGGIHSATIGAAREAGASVFVAGSAIFAPADPGAALARLRESLN